MEDTQHMPTRSSAESGMQDILSLMQTQNTYIHQLYKMVMTTCSDVQVLNNKDFQDFTGHFARFMQHHSSSMGFSQALDAIRIYHFALLEILLDNQIVAAAEQLELAIGCLELMNHEPRTKPNPYMIVLHYGMGLLEETQLKIITLLEELVNSCDRTQLQN